MLHDLIHESDLFFAVFQYLEPRSLARLLRISRQINRFITENQRKIRSFVTAFFRIDVFNFKRAININSTAFYPKQIVFEIGLLDNNACGDIEEIVDGIYRLQNNNKVCIHVKERAKLPMALNLIATRFLYGFQFYSLTVELNKELFESFERFLDYLTEEERIVEKLTINGFCPTEQKLSRLVESLTVKDLSLQGLEEFPFCLTGESDEDVNKYLEERRRLKESNKLSCDFFKRLKNLRAFSGGETDCDIEDAELQHFDSFLISGDASQITFNGLYNWLKFRLESGLAGCQFSAKGISFIDKMRKQLKKDFPNFYCSKNGEDFYHRHSSGRWLQVSLFYDQTSITIHPAYTEHLKLNPNEGLRVTLKIPFEGAHFVTLYNGKSGESDLFEITNKLPTNALVTVVDSLADNVFIYETGLRNYVIYVDVEELDRSNIIKALKAFGPRIKEENFVSATCLGEPENVSLENLLAIRQAFRPTFKIKTLRGKSEMSVELLSKVIQSYSIKCFSTECHIPLSTKFFEQTPTLKSLTMHKPGLESGKLGITDDILQNLHHVLAPHAETNVTLNGLRAWFMTRLNADVDEDCYFEIKFRAPSECVENTDCFFNKLVQGLVGTRGKYHNNCYKFRSQGRTKNALQVQLFTGNLHTIELRVCRNI